MANEFQMTFVIIVLTDKERHPILVELIDILTAAIIGTIVRILNSTSF